MPAVMTEKIRVRKAILPEFGMEYLDVLYIDLRKLCDLLPFIEEGSRLELYIIEIRDGQGRLIRRFKPM
mgnify:CR=1 FL=1